MKKILSILLIVIAFSLNAQVTGITLPKLKNGSIQIDTTGKKLKSWILYRLENHTAGKMVSYNELLMDSLEAGNYWLLATSNNPNYPFNYCFEAQYSIGVLPPTPCPTSNNLDITTYQDNSMWYFCGSSNAWPPINSLQWYLDSLPINSGYYQVQNFCKNAVIATDNVFTLVSYGNTCNEYKTVTNAFTNLTYPHVTVFAGSGSFTGGSNTSGGNNGSGGTTIVSLKEIVSTSIDIYPNPFNDNLAITNTENSIIKIYDMLGSLLFQESGNLINLNTSKLTKGNYILEVSNSNTVFKRIVTKD